jgi:hypothetical protein
VIELVFDLARHEQTRLAAVLEAVGASYDPAEVLAGELEAHALLYSGLDAEQQRIYGELMTGGVLGS